MPHEERKTPIPKPRIARVVFGLVVAVAVPLAPIVVYLGIFGGTGFAVLAVGYVGLYAVAAIVVFGLPTLWLVGHRAVSGPLAALLGAAIASAPALLFGLFAQRSALLLMIFSLPLGALGGLFFWAFGLPPPGRRRTR